MRVLVAYASADGSTAEIAERIGTHLRGHGHDVSVQPAGRVHGLDDVDAVVVGSAVHARQWLEEAMTFLNTNRLALAARPLWVFSVGMPDALPRPVREVAKTEETAIIDHLGDLQPVGHQLFSGVVKRSQFPLASRLFLRLAGGRFGDFRDWPTIDRWAEGLAERLDALAA